MATTLGYVLAIYAVKYFLIDLVLSLLAALLLVEQSLLPIHSRQ